MPTDDMILPASLRDVEQLLLEGPPCGQADVAVRLITTTGLHINSLIIRCRVFDEVHLFWTIRGDGFKRWPPCQRPLGYWAIVR